MSRPTLQVHPREEASGGSTDAIPDRGRGLENETARAIWSDEEPSTGETWFSCEVFLNCKRSFGPAIRVPREARYGTTPEDGELESTTDRGAPTDTCNNDTMADAIARSPSHARLAFRDTSNTTRE